MRTGAAASIKIDEAVLIEQVRQGDTSAMEKLILKYQNRIFNVILKICGNRDDAAELSQETFVKVIEGIDRFQGRSSFYTWAFRIAVNLTLNYCQRNAKVEFRSLDSASDEKDGKSVDALRDFFCNENSPDPATVAQRRELYDIALRSLLNLDKAQRAVIVLRDIEGMSYAQIANVLDIELGTVRSRLSRAREHLKQILEAILQ